MWREQAKRAAVACSAFAVSDERNINANSRCQRRSFAVSQFSAVVPNPCSFHWVNRRHARERCVGAYLRAPTRWMCWICIYDFLCCRQTPLTSIHSFRFSLDIFFFSFPLADGSASILKYKHCKHLTAHVWHKAEWIIFRHLIYLWEIFKLLLGDILALYSSHPVILRI